jgi:transcription antitermination factor NusG
MNEYSPEVLWYVVHTYSGYENKVKTSLETAIKNRGMSDYFFDIQIPVETVVEVDGDNLNCFECKVTKDNVTLPDAFARVYPQCTFSVATTKNFYRYFQK